MCQMQSGSPAWPSCTGVSADALLWDNAPSVEAMQLAAQFDSLTDAKQRQLRALWMAYIENAADDATVEDRMPATRRVTPNKV